MESPQMYDSNQNQLTSDIKKVALTMAAHNNNLKHQVMAPNMHQKQHQQLQQVQVHQPAYNPSDLEELTSQEISLDLAHLIDDQFRDQESLALFSELVPAVQGATQTAAGKVLRLSQRPNPSYSQLAYMPGCVTGSYSDLR